MSVTASQAYAAVKARLDGAGFSFPLRYQGEDSGPLPDTPATFAFVVFGNDGSGRGPVAFGGGRGANLYRNQGVIEAFVFVPNGEGLSAAMDAAELVAARLRSFRDTISCFSADVIPVGEGSKIAPPGLNSEVSNYQCAVAEIAMHFDQIG
jgi:hypothetical protein